MILGKCGKSLEIRETPGGTCLDVDLQQALVGVSSVEEAIWPETKAQRTAAFFLIVESSTSISGIGDLPNEGHMTSSWLDNF